MYELDVDTWTVEWTELLEIIDSQDWVPLSQNANLETGNRFRFLIVKAIKITRKLNENE